MSIKYQILLIAMIPVLLIDGFFTWVNIRNGIEQSEQLLQSKGEVVAQQIASASEFNMMSGNFSQIKHLLQLSLNDNDIVYLALYGLDGKIIVSAKTKNFDDKATPDYSYYRHPILSQNLDMQDVFQPDRPTNADAPQTLGWIHMYISRQKLMQKKREIIVQSSILFIAMLLLAVLLTLAISRRLTRPIYTLLNHLKRVETGHLGEVIDDIEGNEIGDVQKGFNSMSRALLANRMQLDQEIKKATLDLMNAITSLEYNNRELSMARDKAQQADRIKTRFLANMSHEIRTPINGIQGFINLLANSGLQPDQQRYADIIVRATHDLTKIINEILDFSKIESDKIELSNERFDLYEILETTRDSLLAGAMEKNIDLYLCIYSDTPAAMIGDPLRIKQILINLIGNAIKFTDHGFVAVTVMLQDEDDDSVMLQIDIEDSGIGISEQDQKSLFQAFKQIESDTNRRFSGTGLGLVISRNLAHLMGGDIKLKSEPGNGSCFTLLVPLQKDKDAPPPGNIEIGRAMIYGADRRALKEVQTRLNHAGYTTETQLLDTASDIDQLQQTLRLNLANLELIVLDLRHAPACLPALIDADIRARCPVIITHYDASLVDLALYPDCRFIAIIQHSSELKTLLHRPQIDHQPLPAAAPASPISPKELLIVDDNPINLALASELTRLWGHHPQQASNAEEAMALFRNAHFDLILLDIQMPEIDGIRLMQMMREFNPDLTTPIVAITANVLDEEKNRLLKLGFDAFISKPIDENTLKSLLDEEITPSPGAEQESQANDIETSVDYDLTRKLSANNITLMKSTFAMLQLELSDYVQEITAAIDTAEYGQISAITHKLQGVCCYAGLPRLKKLLGDYQQAKKIDKDAVIQVCRDIRTELLHIGDILQQRNEAEF